MKKMSLALPLMALVLSALTGCGGSNASESNGSNGVEPTLGIKRSSSGTNSDGHAYQTFSYVIIPSTMDSRLTSSIAFADSRTNGASYLTSSIDTATDTFTVTCLQAFDSVATLTIGVDGYSDLTASTTINYKQKITDASYPTTAPVVSITGGDSAPKWANTAWSTLVPITQTIDTVYTIESQIGTTLMSDFSLNSSGYSGNAAFEALGHDETWETINNALYAASLTVFNDFKTTTSKQNTVAAQNPNSYYNLFKAALDTSLTDVYANSSAVERLALCLDTNGDFIYNIHFSALTFSTPVDGGTNTLITKTDDWAFTLSLDSTYLSPHGVAKSMVLESSSITF